MESPAEIAKRVADEKAATDAANAAKKPSAVQTPENVAAQKKAMDEAPGKPVTENKPAQDKPAQPVVNNDPRKRDMETTPKVAPASTQPDESKTEHVARQVDNVKFPDKPTTPQHVTVKEGEFQRDPKGSEGGVTNPATSDEIREHNESLIGKPNITPPRAEGIGRSGSMPRDVSPVAAPAHQSFQSGPTGGGSAKKIQYTVLNGTRPGLPFEVADNESRIARAAFANGEDATKFSDLINKQ